jgi:DNA-binding beta-propeller fold protein YncE
VGTLTSPGLCSPRGVASLPNGDVLVGSDCSGLHHMERFNSAGSFVGSWPFPADYQGSPNGVTLDASGNVLVTDYDGQRVQEFTQTGTLLASWTTGLGPADIAVNSSGDVFVAALNGHQVQKFTSGGALLGAIGTFGIGPGQIQDPVGLAVDGSDRIYVVDTTRMRVIRYLANGTFDMEFAMPFPVAAGSLTDAAVGPDGNIYVLRFEGGCLQFTSSGTYLQGVGSPFGLNGPYRIFITPGGTMFISEQYNNRITKFQITGLTAAERMTFGRLKAMYR